MQYIKTYSIYSYADYVQTNIVSTSLKKVKKSRQVEHVLIVKTTWVQLLDSRTSQWETTSNISIHPKKVLVYIYGKYLSSKTRHFLSIKPFHSQTLASAASRCSSCCCTLATFEASCSCIAVCRVQKTQKGFESSIGKHAPCQIHFASFWMWMKLLVEENIADPLD